jgi:hypothetical protein
MPVHIIHCASRFGSDQRVDGIDVGCVCVNFAINFEEGIIVCQSETPSKLRSYQVSRHFSAVEGRGDY